MFAAHSLGLFSKLTGVEVLPSLHNAAGLVLRQSNQFHGHDEFSAPPLRFVYGDATRIDWSNVADVAFAHATAFDRHMRDRLGQLAAKMKPGSFYISLTHRYGELESELRLRLELVQ